MSVEALLGTDRVFAADLQALRPHPGQAAARREPARAARRLGDHGLAPGRLAAPASRTPTRCAAPRRSPGPPATPSRTPRTVAARELAARDRQPGRAAPTAGWSRTATSTAPRSPTCSTSSPSRSPTSPRCPSAAPTACWTWPATTACPPFLADDPGVDSGAHDRPVHPGGASSSELKRLAVPASVGLDPQLGHAGGPRLDGLVGRAQAAPRRRRPHPGARHRDRSPRPAPSTCARPLAPGPGDRRGGRRAARGRTRARAGPVPRPGDRAGGPAWSPTARSSPPPSRWSARCAEAATARARMPAGPRAASDRGSGRA